MMKERAMAFLIGLIMIFSVIGFAFSSAVFFFSSGKKPLPEIPTIVTKKLKPDEILVVLQTGKVLIEDFYPENCSKCLERNAELEKFANSFDGFVVLEKVVANETLLQMIGAGGEIIDLSNKEINRTVLLDNFCKIAMLQPQECLLKEI